MEMNNQAEILRRFSQRRPHVVLAWDDNAKKVVAPPTQVGMSWNQACSSLVHSGSGLVDNFDVPKELFELPNLDSVLTMEAWESCLSPSEKELVSIYLPEGVDQDMAVRAVLNGENLHFGNPLQAWGASVCSGAMHPDELVKGEAASSKSRREQRKHLRTYHEKMKSQLQTMKDIWSECRNNTEVLPRISRWLRSSQRGNISPTRNGFILKRPSESDEARTKDGRSEDRHEDSKTTRKDKKKEIHNRHNAKRLKTGLAGDGSVNNAVHQPDFESDFFKKYVEVSVGALTRDQLASITVPVKVTRKQFENLKSRRQAGEEVDFDSLDTEENKASTAECKATKNQMDVKDVETLRRYWREQVVKSLPGAHIKFLERKTSLLRLADSIARSCMEERVYFMRENEEPCSPDRVAPKSSEDRIPTDASGSGVEDDTFSQNWRGKHLLDGAVSEDAEEEFITHSPQEEPMDLSSASDEEDVNSSDEKEGQQLDAPSRSGEKISSSECSPVSKVEDEGRVEGSAISFTPQSPLKDVQPEGSFESGASIMPSMRLYEHEGRRLRADSLPGYEVEASAVDSVLITGQHTFSAEHPTPKFSLPEKQELQLLPHGRQIEVPNLHHLGALPQSIQEPAQLFAEHTQMSHQYESPISSLINFSKRQHQLNAPPPSLPHHPYPSYSLPSSAALPMAVPVVELAPMWPGAVHRPSPSALPQFGSGQNGSWPLPDGTASGGGWGLSEALQSASRRAHLQVPPPAPAAPVHRWETQNRNVYPTEQTASKPERVFDQQQFYTDWSSRSEFPAAPSQSESATPYRLPSWYPTGPFDNVSNPLSGNPMQQHLPLQRHLWPAESAPPKPVPQLWGNVNWRPS